jgi:hypothetical protein
MNRYYIDSIPIPVGGLLIASVVSCCIIEIEANCLQEEIGHDIKGMVAYAALHHRHLSPLSLTTPSVHPT